MLLPETARQQQQGKDVVIRAHATFAKPEVYEALEARGVKYAIRIPSNETLEQAVAELLRRPVGRPSHKPVVRYRSFRYQAGSWKIARRVVAKIEFHCEELFPRVGFIVTTLEAASRAVVRFYNKRGTVEQWIKAGKEAVKLGRLSCHRFRANEVRLSLSVIAYNLGNLWRRLVKHALLLAAAGRRTPDLAAVRGDPSAAGSAAGVSRLADAVGAVEAGGTESGGEVSEKSAGKSTATPGLGGWEGQDGAFWEPPCTVGAENRLGSLRWEEFGNPKWKSRIPRHRGGETRPRCRSGEISTAHVRRFKSALTGFQIRASGTLSCDER